MEKELFQELASTHGVAWTADNGDVHCHVDELKAFVEDIAYRAYRAGWEAATGAAADSYNEQAMQTADPDEASREVDRLLYAK